MTLLVRYGGTGTRAFDTSLHHRESMEGTSGRRVTVAHVTAGCGDKSLFLHRTGQSIFLPSVMSVVNGLLLSVCPG